MKKGRRKTGWSLLAGVALSVYQPPSYFPVSTHPGKEKKGFCMSKYLRQKRLLIWFISCFLNASPFCCC